MGVFVCLCACACICVKMCAYLQHVSMCQGTLAPADEEIMSVSPPMVTSCPPTPGVFLTRLSYWLLVILIHFHLCLPACLPGATPFSTSSLCFIRHFINVWDGFFFSSLWSQPKLFIYLFCFYCFPNFRWGHLIRHLGCFMPSRALVCCLKLG